MARDNTPTERRGYQRPPIGDDWAGAWDDLVEDTDELAIERGPIADRPPTGAYDDALYLAVDQRTMWRWDASASDWEAVSGLGTAPDPVPGTSYFESVSTAQLGSNHFFAGDQDGADPDARLDSALSSASDGDTIFLENADYSATRTIGTRVRIVGTGGAGTPNGASFSGDLTVTVAVEFSGVAFDGSATVSISGRPVRIIGGGGTGIPSFTISADDFVMTGASYEGASLTFESGTSGGIVDSCSQINVSDNGTNTVGDIA